MSRRRRHAPPPSRILHYDDEDFTSLLNSTPTSPPPRTPPPPHHVHITSSPLTIAHFESPRHPSSPPLSPPPYSHPPPSPSTPASPNPPFLLTALTHWRLSLLSHHLHLWRLSTRLALSSRRRASLLSLLFHRWREHSSQAKAHRHRTLTALQHWAQGTQRRAFHQWVKGVQGSEVVAVQWRRDRQYRRVLQGWSAYTGRRRRLYTIAHRVVDLSESRCLQDAFAVWRGQAHTLHLGTAAYLTHALTQALHMWMAVTLQSTHRRLILHSAEEVQAAGVVRCQRRAVDWWVQWVGRTQWAKKRELEVLHFRLHRWMRRWKQQIPSLPSQRMGALTHRAVGHRLHSLQQRPFLAWHAYCRGLHTRGAHLREVEDRRCIVAVWVTWRCVWEWVHRRRQEEEQRAVIQWERRDAQAFSSIFYHWWMRSREVQQQRRNTAVADVHHRTSQLRSSVSHWASLTAAHVTARRQWSAAVQHHRDRLMTAAWKWWQSRAHQRQAIQRLLQSINIERMRRSMLSWQGQVHHTKATTFLHHRHHLALSSAITAWYDTAHTAAVLRSAGARMSQSLDHQLVMTAFRHWYSSSILHRHTRLSTLRSFLHAWREVQRTHRDETRVTTIAWMTWREVVRTSHTQLQHADTHYRRLSLQPAITALHQHSLHNTELRRKQRMASTHYQRKLASSNPIPFLRTAYLAWYYFTRHRRLLTHSSSLISHRHNTTLTRDALILWYQQTAQLSAASQWRVQRCVSDAVQRWRGWLKDRKGTRETEAVLMRLKNEGMQRRARESVTEWWEWAAHRRLHRHEERLAHLFHIRILFLAWRETVPAEPHRMQAKRLMAEGHYTAHLQRRATASWKRVVEEVTSERQIVEGMWEERRTGTMKRRVMGEWKRRFEGVREWTVAAVQQCERQLNRDLRRAFGQWRFASVQKKADLTAVERGRVHHRRFRLHAACALWRAVTVVHSGERLRFIRVESRQHRALQLAALSAWAHRTALSQAAAVMSGYTIRLQQQTALNQWKEAALQIRAIAHADGLYYQMLATSLYQWHHHTRSQSRDRACTLTIISLSQHHLLSSALNTWMTSFHHHRHSSHIGSLISTAHHVRLQQSTWAAWREARDVACKIRLMLLRRWWKRWKVELKMRRVNTRTLTQAMRVWRTVGREEREREEASQGVLTVKVQREAMRRWRQRSLTHRIFRHWRQRTAQLLLLAGHLNTAAHHHRLTCKRSAVHSLRLHSQRARARKALLDDARSHSKRHLVCQFMGVWREGTQQSRALKVIIARTEAYQCEAALNQWQGVTWYDRAVHFHEVTSRQHAVLALYVWAQRRHQWKADEALVERVREEKERTLIGDAFSVWLHSFHRSLRLHEEERLVAADYNRRFAQTVLLFWLNAAIIHRHFRLRSIKAAWGMWVGRMRSIGQRRQEQRQALLAWKGEMKRRADVERGFVLHRRQRQLSVALHVLLGFTRRRKIRKGQRSRALEWERQRQQRKVWIQWTHHQHTAQLSRTQLVLAAQYHSSIRCVDAIQQWKRRIDLDRQRKAAVVALQLTQKERRKRSALMRWHQGSVIRGRIQRLHQRTSRAIFVSWRSLTIACTHDTARLMSETWGTWRTAAHNASQWRRAVERSRLRDQTMVTRVFRVWRAQHSNHTATLTVGDRVRELWRHRRALDIWMGWRRLTEALRSRMKPLEQKAVTFYQRRRLLSTLTEWRRGWSERRVRMSKMEEAAVSWDELTVKRRSLDMWEERTSERMKGRHLQSTQAIRIRIAMRAYHTSLLLHTFSQWRAAAAAMHDQFPSSSFPSSDPSSSSHLRLTSLSDLRRFIQQQRLEGGAACLEIGRGVHTADTFNVDLDGIDESIFGTIGGGSGVKAEYCGVDGGKEGRRLGDGGVGEEAGNGEGRVGTEGRQSTES